MHTLASHSCHECAKQLTVQANGCIHSESRHHALALRAVRPLHFAGVATTRANSITVIGLRPLAVVDNRTSGQRDTAVLESTPTGKVFPRDLAHREPSTSIPHPRSGAHSSASQATSHDGVARRALPGGTPRSGNAANRTGDSRMGSVRTNRVGRASSTRLARPGSHAIRFRSPRRCGLSPAACHLRFSAKQLTRTWD